MQVGPIIAGSMAENVGWRSFFWLNVGILGFLLLLQIFLFPETKWNRVHENEVSDNKQVPANGPPAESKEEKPIEISQHENVDMEGNAKRDPYLHKGTPSRKQFRLWQPADNSIKSVLIGFWTPWKLLCFPIIELAAFVVSWSASVMLTLNLTQSQVFSEPPYNFKSQTIGFFNFAILVGSFIGLSTNGVFSDWISMKATRKNGGIREPEMRLPAMIPYAIISIIGNFVVAFGYEYKWDWRVSFHCSRLSQGTLALNQNLGHRHYRILRGRNPSGSPSGHREHICGRQLQASRGFIICVHHGE